MTEPRQMVFKDAAPDDTSDGRHTFRDLYRHREALLLALTASLPGSWTWKSREHHPDDPHPMFDGYFIVGIDLPNGTVTYHCPIDSWNKFAHVTSYNEARPWDGATPEDSITRLTDWATQS